MTMGSDETARQMIGAGIRFEARDRYRLFRFNDVNSNYAYDGVDEESPFPSEPAVRQRLISTLGLRIYRDDIPENPDNDVLLFDRNGFPRYAGMGFQELSIIVSDLQSLNVQRRESGPYQDKRRRLERQWVSGTIRIFIYRAE